MDTYILNVSQLLTLKNEEDRYGKLKSLLSSHRDYKVVFSDPTPGVSDTISITVPNNDAITNPPRYIDFNNWKINISNNHSQPGKCLLYIQNTASQENIHITPAQVDSLDYRQSRKYLDGKKILIVRDQRKWTKRTDSADDDYYRREDAILLEDGIAQNGPIASYDNPETAMDYYYYDVTSEEPVVLKNLVFERVAGDSHNVIGLVSVYGYDDVTFENIECLFSPAGYKNNPTKSGDTIFDIQYCTNVKFKDINIDGTYSKDDAYGYAFRLQTLTNVVFQNVDACGKWGVFGNFNINNILIDGCEINRFDIHCYGRDAKIIDTKFSNALSSNNNYNQISSFFGELSFVGCEFLNFVPLLFEPSYHTYTPFHLSMIGCQYTPTIDGVIINAGYVNSPGTVPLRRSSLCKVCWPDVHIEDLKIIASGAVSLYLFKIYDSVNPATPISHISQATINLASESVAATVYFANKLLMTEETIETKTCDKDLTILSVPGGPSTI